MPEGNASLTAADRLRLRFWGVRGSIPTPEAGFLGVGGNTACVEVDAGGASTVVLDAGTGIRGLGHRLAWGGPEGRSDVHLFLSHFHWDHIQGLPFFGPLYGEAFRVTIYGLGDEAALADVLRGQMRAPYYPVPFEQLPAEIRLVGLTPGAAVTVGPLTVRPFPVRHTQPTLGFRVEAHGAAAVYATDHEHGDPILDAGLVAAAAGADLLVCDAQYTPEEYVVRRGWGHTTWRHAAGFAAEAGAARLALFHHDPTHDDDDLARILDDARTVFPATTLATEGLEVVLGE
ncbi:MAG TPA: MBL fold metallo-hydrolase [Rhodothermales bacterium]|nr:MBL fold metallo-hydrolase [Rhodothermales bacterium]